MSTTKPLTLMERLHRYYRQTGRDSATARQMRRVRHKVNRAQARADRARTGRLAAYYRGEDLAGGAR